MVAETFWLQINSSNNFIIDTSKAPPSGSGKTWFHKKSQKIPKNELEKALYLMNEYFQQKNI